MNPVGSAPALVVLLALTAALSSAGCGLNLPSATLVGVTMATGTLCFVEGIQRRDFRRVALFVVLLSAGLCLLSVFRAGREPRLSENLAGDFEVIMERSWGGRRLVLLDGPPGRYIARMNPSGTFTEGTMVHVEGTVRTLEHAGKSGDFDEHDYWRARGAEGTLRIQQIKTLKVKGSRLHLWRQHLREQILLRLPPRVRGYLLACWLGDRDPDLREDHRRWGTAHLLAVSGFHVGLVCSLGYWLFRRRKGRELVITLMLWSYVLMAGGAASALRAALMIEVMLIGSVLGRGANPLNSVAAAAALLLLWRPWWFWDVGWRLSVLAALTLAALSRSKSPWRVLVASPLIWAVTAGQGAWTFGSVPLAGLIMNLVALPLFALLLPLAALVSLPALAGLCGASALPAEMLFHLWEAGADLVTGLVPHVVHGSTGLGIFSGGIFLWILCRSLAFSRKRTAVITAFLLATGTCLFY